MDFSPNVTALKPSATLALAARARELKRQGIPVIDLSAGEPAYGTPPYAAEAGIRAIRDGHTGYPPTSGALPLRESIASYLVETTRASEVDPTSVIVSAGVKQALFNCTYTLFGPGEPQQAHAIDEHIEVKDLVDGAKVYALTALSMCGGAAG